MLFSIYIPGRLLCYIFIHTYLADFLKTKLAKEICSHLSKKASKDRFLGLISSKITLTKDKGRRKRKSEDVDRRRGEKSNGCTLNFYNGYCLETVFGQKNTVGRKRFI